MKKFILIVIAIAIIAGIVYYTKKSSAPTNEDVTTREEVSTSTPESNLENGAMVVGSTTTPVASEVREFTMDSFMKTEGSARIAGFSVKEITVKKGDKVKITVINTAGTHDFNIDEYKINKETPEGQKTVIEFTADTVGDFKYYCAKYNHRQLGQEGTLHVTE